MDKKKALGQRIKELRKRKGISQEQLAEMVNLEPPSICNIETGRNYPTFQNLEKIIDILDTNFVEIFKFDKYQESEDLISEINKMLVENPGKIQDIYKVVKALLE